ncbi:hypothetical protein [Stenotrophomonas maltophilia]|uniref:hypothetical protein n=1 Tax=Stenotrophomonas maltophilia TaxID=40324 RepID=UPI002B1E8401|nr:hypothetical protein [Stenotrophomonas maltophilia]
MRSLILAATVLPLALAACRNTTDPTAQLSTCVESHVETSAQPMLMPTGNGGITTYLMSTTTEVCDRRVVEVVHNPYYKGAN